MKRVAQRIALAVGVFGLFVGVGGARAGEAEALRVMSFNLWHGGEAGKQPIAQTAKVIEASGAEIAGLQECLGFEIDGVRPNRGADLARLLGWHFIEQEGGKGILSRHPIEAVTPKRYGAVIRLPSGRRVFLFNAHLAHAPYQPYQLLGIPYADGRFIKTAAEAIDEAAKARGHQVKALLDELRIALMSGLPVFLTGDFNEPSPQDWTARAAAAGRVPLAVEYPSIRAVLAAGLRDAFRVIYPDELERPGWTWTPTTEPTDPRDKHDRIDFVLFAGDGVRVRRVAIIGESEEFADVIVRPYPSDHRAVTADFELAEAGSN